MKRDLALRNLSVDHHHGLMHAHRLQKAARGEEDLPRTAHDFLLFWEKDTRFHFREEEEILLPIVSRHSQLVEEEPVRRMLLEHILIRALVLELQEQQAQGEIRPETVGKMGEMLEAHIRLEERTIFPAIQEALSPEALQDLADHLRRSD